MLTTARQMRFGTLEPVPRTYALRAGPLSLEFQDGIFRNLRCGEMEVVQAVYAAVRDVEWGTVPGTISHLLLDTHAGGFAMHYQSTHRKDALHFTWQVDVVGDADGQVEWKFNGRAHGEFEANRLGACVLHPLSCAGRRCTVLHTDGSPETQAFPDAIAPAPIFQDVRELRYPIGDGGLEAAIRLDGDVFETEDQRNWCDGSYKTYSRPLRLPWPQTIAAGSTVVQTVQLSLHGDLPRRSHVSRAPVEISLQMERQRPLPAMGCVLEPAHVPTGRGMERLRRLQLQFLLVDATDLQGSAVSIAQELKLPLDVVLRRGADLSALQEVHGAGRARLRRLLVAGTAPEALEFAEQLAQRFGLPVLPGSAWNYAELNRCRPAADTWKQMWFAVQPQVHGTDEISLIESLSAQGAVVRDGARWSGGASMTAVVRFRAPLVLQQSSAWSLHDARQHSLFGAAWTAGSLKHLAEAGASDVVMFAAAGANGLVLDRSDARGIPLFADVEQEVVSPAYHVLRKLASMHGGVSVKTTSSEPEAVEALAMLSAAGDLHMVLANYTDRVQTASLPAAGLVSSARVQVLDESTVELAVCAPEVYATHVQREMRAQDGSFHFELQPCATVYVHLGPTDRSTGRESAAR